MPITIGVSVAHAQASSTRAVVDSAREARTAWARASTALRARDSATALRELARARGAWPTQHAYSWGHAVLAAALHDTAAALSALQAYAALGVGRDVRSVPALAALTSVPAFVPTVARLDANSIPLSRSEPVARLADSTFWPEGVDYDSAQRAYYVASVRHRTIAMIGADGSSREIVSRHQAGVGAVLGVRFDARRKVLWATTSGLPVSAGAVAADSAIAALLQIDPRTGLLERRWDLAPVPGGHVLGDLAIASSGDVWITDSNDPVVYRLRSPSDSLEAFRHPLFRSLQGIAPSADGRFVFVADYSHGILRMNPATGEVVRLKDAPQSTSLGCDGLVLRGSSLIAVQNGLPIPRVVRFALSAAQDSITAVEVLDRNRALADEPTIGTLVGDSFVYVANSQWDKHGPRGDVRPNSTLTPPLLLKVSLPQW